MEFKLYFIHRPYGAFQGIITTRDQTLVDPASIERLLEEFLQLENQPAEQNALAVVQ